MLTSQSDITSAVHANSANELQNLFGQIHAILPIELRENVYKYLLDYDTPTILPQDAKSYQPYKNEFYFDQSLVGSPTALEIRDLYMRAIPTYFQIELGSNDQTSEILVVLGTYFHETGKAFRHMVRHVRLLLRCEDFNQLAWEMQSSVPPVLRNDPEYKSHGELFALEKIRSKFAELKSLPYENQHIKVEICIRQSDELPCFGINTEKKNNRVYNLLETVKDVYFHAKNAGADIAVFVQNSYSGAIIDTTWQLDLDADQYVEVSFFSWSIHVTAFFKLTQIAIKRQRPIYSFIMQDQPPAEREAWIARVNSALGNQPLLQHTTDLPWLRAFAMLCPWPHSAGFQDYGDGLEHFDFESFLMQPDDGADPLRTSFDFGYDEDEDTL